MRGFSLVELSIVLVILGLLTGGILAGQSLIRAAELRAVTTEYNQYNVAVMTFRDKYFAIPGDMRDATKFWGRQVSAAHCVTNSSAAVVASTGVCDGDGNGLIATSTTASQSGENFQFWRHLAAAGLLEGSYTGLSGSGGTRQVVRGENSPTSKLGQSSWTSIGFGPHDGTSFMWANNYGNAFIYGAVEATDITESSNMKPEELWNIDTKIDDGRPSYGKVTLYRGGSLNCQTEGNQPQANASDNEYNLSNDSIDCFAVMDAPY